jgi:hypothetical protein
LEMGSGAAATTTNRLWLEFLGILRIRPIASWNAKKRDGRGAWAVIFYNAQSTGGLSSTVPEALARAAYEGKRYKTNEHVS